MKVSGVDGLSRGDLMEGMMTGRNPLSFVPFNRGVDERSGGQVSTWVCSWWRTKKGFDFGGFILNTITKDNRYGASQCGPLNNALNPILGLKNSFIALIFRYIPLHTFGANHFYKGGNQK
jgi:hypothetical protein